MSRAAIVMHVLGAGHGMAAGLASVAAFYVAGILLLPRRWAVSIGGPGPAFVGAALYVVLSWVAITSRNIPLLDVVLAFGAALCIIAMLRFRWFQFFVRSHAFDPSTKHWMLSFSIFYALTYILILPPAGDTYLPLAPAGNLDLVTYARYARQVLEFGTPGLDLTAFDYLRSPASTFFLAWQSLFFGRDPLTAAMPTLFAMTAVFGTVAAGTARRVFGLSSFASMAMACIIITSPLLRWVLSSYSLPTVLAAVILLHLLGALSLAVSRRQADGPLVAGFLAGCMLLPFAGLLSLGSWADAARAAGRLLVSASPLALLAWPSPIARIQAGGADHSAGVGILPLMAFVLAGFAYGVRRSGLLNRIARFEPDRRLVRALLAYAVVTLVAGNIAVGAVRDPAALRITAAWRNLDGVNRLPFRALTLKMDAARDSLSSALALYFLASKKTQVLGSEIEVDDLQFDAVSRYQPLFIHRVVCEGVGHDDTVPAEGIGCLVSSPPSMTVGRSYPFNRVFLFMTYEGMTAREPGGRWNTRPTLQLNVTSDPQRATLDRDMFVNFFVNPFLPAGVKPQRLVFRWGRDRLGETSVGEQEWLSVPVRSGDWSGNRLWTLPITIDFLDGRTILFHELSLTETPRGTLVTRR